MKFMEACISGDALLEEIEDYVDEWHEGDSEEGLHEYLGMTEEEYAIWVENDAALKTIFHARKVGIPIGSFIRQDRGQSLVARSASAKEAEQIKEWLQRTGRI